MTRSALVLPVLIFGLAQAGCATRPIESVRTSADFQFQHQEYQQAAIGYSEIADRAPGDWQAQYRLGLCELELGNPDRARTALAVNTLTFKDDEIHGDNTDGIGLLRDLTANLGIKLDEANILILGAGGATRGIVAPLLETKPASLRIANRTLGRAVALVDQFKDMGPVSSCRFSEVPVTEPYDLVINATSASVRGEIPPYPEAVISVATFCYDLSYALSPTPFVEWSRERGCAQAVMGWGMLVEQAAESFHIWRNVMPDTAPVLKQLSFSA